MPIECELGLATEFGSIGISLEYVVLKPVQHSVGLTLERFRTVDISNQERALGGSPFKGYCLHLTIWRFGDVWRKSSYLRRQRNRKPAVDRCKQIGWLDLY